MEPSNIYLAATVVCSLIGLGIWLWLWLTRDRNLNQKPVKDIWQRTIIHLIWLALYLLPVIAYLMIAFVFIGQDLIEQDGTWHQTIVRDESEPDFTTILTLFAITIFFTSGIGSYLYAITRLPFYSEKTNSAYLIFILMPYVLAAYLVFYFLPNNGIGSYDTFSPLSTALHIVWLFSLLAVCYQGIVNLLAVVRAYRQNQSLNN